MTLSFKDAQVQDVFKEINRQTGLDFVYNLTQLQEINPVTVQVKDVTVDEALKQLLKDTDFEYRFEMGSIVIRRKEASPVKQERSIKAREIGLEKMKRNALYISRFSVFCHIRQNASLGSIMRGFRYQVITCYDAA